METKRRRILIKTLIVAAGLVLIAGILVFLFYGENFELFKTFFRKDITAEEIRETTRAFGARGVISVGLLAALQVVLMFFPAEPLHVIAGAGYGLLPGVLICVAGVFIGNTVIYVLYKIFGSRLTEYYKNNIKIDWSSARTARGLTLIVLLLYVLPAIPYGIICVFAASCGLKFPQYTWVTLVGTVPSAFLDVAVGHIAVSTGLITAVIIFVLIVVLIIVLAVNRDKLVARLNAFIAARNVPYSSATAVRKPSRFTAFIFVNAFNIYLFFKFRLKYTNLVKEPVKPCIVLVNHGAFIDFMFSLKLLKKYYPNVIAARLYFYHKFMGTNMKRGGVFPKSMFAADLENAKNCLTVLKNKGMLIMMPEARLSTVGRYEGIQDSTMRFLYKQDAEIYTLKIDGNYFAMPKWGDKPRRRAPVECTFSRFMSAEEKSETGYKEFADRVNAAMDYNQFEWLAARPDVKYKSKTLAKGLENILFACPECGAECSFTSEGRKITCSACGMQAELDSRYAFKGGLPFENFQQWYDWQYEKLKEKILSDPAFSLTAKVELKHSSKDGKTCLRHAGEGVCVFDSNGLTYKGTEDGEEVNLFFARESFYRLLFGAGEDFEIYVGKEIYYFVPEEKRECVKWYAASCIFGELREKEEVK